MTPRALVIAPRFDVRGMAADLERELLNATLTAQIEAQIRNVATVQDDKGVYLLYDFLDKGTQPHWIGEADELLANRRNDFGPVWGPVFHPGTRPFDITARTGSYIQNYFERMVAEGVDTRSTDTIQWREIRLLIVDGLLAAMDFARNITPDNWSSVKASYQLYLNGRRYQDS
jgi:hypothetical protein